MFRLTRTTRSTSFVTRARCGVAVIALLALFASACGGGSDTSATPTDVEPADAETPTESSEPEPTAEPEPTPEPEPTATTAPEPEPTAEPEPEPDAEPEPEPDADEEAETEQEQPTVAADQRFSITAVTFEGNGPAGGEAADFDGDGDLDIVMNFFGDRGDNPGPIEFPPGGITIFWNEGGLDQWRPEPIIDQDDGDYFPNEALPRDIDGDGDYDIMVGAGFFVCELNPEIGPCGALFWLENDNGEWIRRDIVERGSVGFFHRSEFADLDGDGIDDLITVAEFQDDAEAQWYRGTADGVRFETEPRVIGQGGGSLPVAHDVDGDGDIDVASGEFFLAGTSYVWFENVSPPSDTDPAGTWERHVIDASVGRTIQIAVIENLTGDGTDGWVGSNHVANREGEPPASIHLLEPSDDPREPWRLTPISDGIESRPTVGTAFQAAPGVFSYGDVDDDGDIDLTVSGDGDARIFWFEQTEPGVFAQHVLAEDFGQAGGGLVEDLDGDGDHEVIFSSYDTHELLIFSFEGDTGPAIDVAASTAAPRWQVQLGSAAADTSFGVTALSSGDLVLAAATEGDLAAANAGGRDIVIGRWAPDGTEVWVNQIGTEKNESPLGISAAPDDSIYVAGFTEGDFASPNQGSADVWLARFDADGNELWRQQFGAEAWDRGFDVSAFDGGAYVTGYSASSLDADSDAGGFDGYVARFDSDGNQEWIRQIGSDATDWGQGSALAPDGGIYVTGYTEGDLASANLGGRDIFVARLDSAGDVVWTRQIGTDALDWTQGVAAGPDGGVLITGSTEGSLGGPHSGGRDLVVVSFDADGNESFITQVGTNELDTGFEVRVVNDQIVVSGSSAGNLGNPAGDRDALLVWLDLDGSVTAIDQIGTDAVDDITGLEVASDGSLVWSGYSYGSLLGTNAGDADLIFGVLEP